MGELSDKRSNSRILARFWRSTTGESRSHITVLIQPNPTSGLLSRGSQVRILPGRAILLENSLIVPSAWAPAAKVQANKVTGPLPRLAD